MAITGNTVRLTVTFTDWDNLPVDPTGITLKVYDAERRQVGATVSVTVADKVSPGVYRVDYTIPEGSDELYAEFSATDTNGKKMLNRALITREYYS